MTENLDILGKQETEPYVEVIFDCSVESETERVKWTVGRNEWYEKNKGYNPKYPELIKRKLENNEEITGADIAGAVTGEFDSQRNQEQTELIGEEWKKIEGKFFENLKTLGLPVQEKYFVTLTKYGTGGSYNAPDCVQLNMERYDASFVLCHEIVHLTIQHLIAKYGIGHWTKERIVDLIMNKFFPERPKLQKYPDKAEEINEIFEQEFPDIEKVIEKVSKLKI